jgi:hypothetical protein
MAIRDYGNTYSDVIDGVNPGLIVGLDLPLGLQILWMLLQAMVQPAITYPGNTSTL